MNALLAVTILSANFGPPPPCQETATAASAEAQPCARPGSSPATLERDEPGTPFVLRVENDSIRFIGGADDSYSQGLSLHVTRKSEWGFLKKPLDWVDPRGGSIRGSSLSIGQTIFTPHNIVTYDPAPGDRPFAGYLWLGAASSALRREARANPALGLGHQRARRVSLELDLGLVGPGAGAHTAQGAFHVLRESRMPKGWYTQLGNSPQINGILRCEDQWLRLERSALRDGKTVPLTWFDFTSDVRLAAGTTQTYAALGGTVRVSPYDIQTFPATTIAMSIAPSAAPSTKPEFGFALVAGGEVRGMAYNKFLDAPDIEPEHLLTEWKFGVEVWWRHWQLSYLQVNRSREFESDQPLPERHAFATIQLTRGYAWKDTPESLDWLKGVRANLRLGRGRSEVEPGVPADPQLSLAASWGVEVPVWRRLVFGWEKASLAREHGRPGASPCTVAPAPCHVDTFLLGDAFSAGVELLPGTSRFGVQVRAGVGPGRIKREEISDTGSLLEPDRETFGVTTESGLAKLVGARVSWRVGAPLSLALDGTWTAIASDDPTRAEASFWTATFGVQIHPMGRNR